MRFSKTDKSKRLNKIEKCIVVIAAIASMASIGFSAEELTLVADGKAKCVIVIADTEEANRVQNISQNYAAKVLQDHVLQMTGVKLETKKGVPASFTVENGKLKPAQPSPDIQNYILLGEGELTRKLDVGVGGLGPGGFRVCTKGNCLVLLGQPNATPTVGKTGILSAVIALLEEKGCRYLWPGETGKVIPKLPTLSVKQMDMSFTPPIGQRNIRLQHQGPRYFDKGLAFLGFPQDSWQPLLKKAMATESACSWEEWQGLNGHALGILGGHNAYGLGMKAKEVLKEHPEWGALQPDGTRDQTKAGDRFRLCVSNMELVEYVSNLIIGLAKEKPDMPSYSLAPQDGGTSNYCMCDNCKKLDPPDAPKISLTVFAKVGESKSSKIEYPSFTDRHVHYWNAVAERVAKVHPKLLLVIDSYAEYSTPPVREKLHPSLVVRYVPSDSSGWEGWKQAGAKKIYWRPNALHSGYREATINKVAAARQIADTTSLLAGSGMLAVDNQGIYDNWATQGVSYYATAHSMWNPKLKYDEILEDYCRSGFGSGANSIKDYFLKAESLGTAFDKTTPEAMNELKKMLDNASAAAAGDEAVQKRIAFLREGLNYSALTAKIAQMRLAAENKQPFDKSEAARLLDLRWNMMRNMFERQPLVVNVALVAGYDDTSWKDLGWRAPGIAVKGTPAKTAEDDSWLYEDQSQLGKKSQPGKK